MTSREPLKLALIVGAARTGTTLLRLLLDAHPEIGCPAEAGIPALIENLGRVWWTVNAVGGRVSPSTDRPADATETPDNAVTNPGDAGVSLFRGLPGVAHQAITEAVLAPMAHYCAPIGKRIYCDKSLDSVQHLEVVRTLFPEVRCILLFRHVMDTVASGIEASPWGFQGYGYAPFIQRSSENFVAALVSYWLAHVDATLRWEQAHPELCHRVRYEELVMEPAKTLAQIFEFLEVAGDLSVLARAFERGRGRAAVGPGDYKVTYTSEVHGASIGRGKRVPVWMIPPPMLDAVNESLATLGYSPLDRTWNAEPRIEEPDHADAGWSTRLAALMRQVKVPRSTNGSPAGSFAVVAEDNPDLRWVIEPSRGEIRQGDGEVDSVVIGTTEDLSLMIADEENLGVLLRSGRIRHVTAREDVPSAEVAETMRSVVELLRIGGRS
jgi:protein-tyrosine sulfotransferase